ncbi:MAG: OadG family protein [Bacteroidales bacterium]|jgi:hypothetical protein|nr:OadG family protein [Bacteroidales bacterium]
MQQKVFKITLLTICLTLSLNLKSETETTNSLPQQAETSSYDPLIPQMFAVDSKTQTIAVINKNENKVEILKRTKNEYQKDTVIPADKVEGRHDVFAIYRLQSVAIYESHIVYLASNRDSSFVSILDMNGNEKHRYRFNGAANAFSFDSQTKMLYIAGDNASGYNVFAIDATEGFDHINIASSPAFSYVKPRKADEIGKHDPWGTGLAMIAMVTVFMALLIICLVLIGFSSSLIKISNRRKGVQPVETKTAIAHTKVQRDSSGEEFAAIATALYLYNEELHDEENTILTINKVAKVYSPWSSKLYNMNVYKR